MRRLRGLNHVIGTILPGEESNSTLLRFDAQTKMIQNDNQIINR